MCDAIFGGCSESHCVGCIQIELLALNPTALVFSRIANAVFVSLMLHQILNRHFSLEKTIHILFEKCQTDAVCFNAPHPTTTKNVATKQLACSGFFFQFIWLLFSTIAHEHNDPNSPIPSGCSSLLFFYFILYRTIPVVISFVVERN